MNKKLMIGLIAVVVLAAIAIGFVFFVLPTLNGEEEEPPQVLYNEPWEDNNSEPEFFEDENGVAFYDLYGDGNFYDENGNYYDEEGNYIAAGSDIATDIGEADLSALVGADTSLAGDNNFVVSYDDLNADQLARVQNGELDMDGLQAELAVQASATGAGLDDLFSGMLDTASEWSSVFDDIDWGSADVLTGSDTQQADVPLASDDDSTTAIGTSIGPDGLVSDDETCLEDDGLNGMGGADDGNAGLPIPADSVGGSGDSADGNGKVPVVTSPAVQTNDWANSTPVVAISFLILLIAGVLLLVRMKKSAYINE